MLVSSAYVLTFEESSAKGKFIEIEGLECVVGHVMRRHYGESKW